MEQAKPFCISKQQVWEAYKRVKANKGAAGVDGQTIEAFEDELKDNLYKLWNRLASGSYFPPPVLRVEIPKGDGRMRPLGIPTVADRIAQMVAKQFLEPELEKYFHPDCVFHGSLPLIPREGCHPFQMKVATCRSGATLGVYQSYSVVDFAVNDDFVFRMDSPFRLMR